MPVARTLLLTSLGVVLLAPAAMANPISTHVLRARQVPSTLHVQVTFGQDTSFGGDTVKAPEVVQKNGEAFEVSWKALSGGYTANTGSGLTTVTAVQFCDCSVTEGEHTYSVKNPPSGISQRA